MDIESIFEIFKNFLKILGISPQTLNNKKSGVCQMLRISSLYGIFFTTSITCIQIFENFFEDCVYISQSKLSTMIFSFYIQGVTNILQYLINVISSYRFNLIEQTIIIKSLSDCKLMKEDKNIKLKKMAAFHLGTHTFFLTLINSILLFW